MGGGGTCSSLVVSSFLFFVLFILCFSPERISAVLQLLKVQCPLDVPTSCIFSKTGRHCPKMGFFSALE